jgi:tetratricopeptide (TPR) repeat protein
MVEQAQAKSGSADWPAAAALWRQVVADNPVHGGYWDCLALARYELGDYRGALDAYRRVDELGVGGRSFDICDSVLGGEVAYRIASCLAGLGDREAAVAELGRALRQGFRDLGRPRDDALWEPLRTDDRVRDMLGLSAAEAADRDQGWRADLAFFARELKRRAWAPFAGMTEAEFDAAVSGLARAAGDLTDAQLIAGLYRLLRPLGDGHAFVTPPEDTSDLNLALPLKFYLFDEGVFVTAAAPEHRGLLGAQVLGYGGRGIDEALAEINPVLPRDNDQQVRWLGPEVLRWTPLTHAIGLLAGPTQAELSVRTPDGTAGQVTVRAVAYGPRTYPTIAPPPSPTRPRPAGWISLPDTLAEPLPLYLRNCDTLYWFEYLAADEAVYFQFNGVGDHPAEPLAAFCGRLLEFIEGHRVSKLIIDLRWNGGGNTLLVPELVRGLIRCRKINRRGALYVIIGRKTFSAAQNTATMLERWTEAIFVGEPSGSRPNFTGETIPFQLPYSKVKVNVSDLFWQTSWPADPRQWIAPDIYVPVTFESYRRNADPALDAILAIRAHLPGSLSWRTVSDYVGRSSTIMNSSRRASPFSALMPQLWNCARVTSDVASGKAEEWDRWRRSLPGGWPAAR